MLKRAYNPQNLELWNDFVRHHMVYDVVTRAIDRELKVDLQVPRVFMYFTRDTQRWWGQNWDKWPSAALREPTDLLETELILPLPKIVRESLIALYCAPHARADALNDPRNRHCLIRVYLGVRRENRNFHSDFSLRNFEADLNILDELQLEKADHARAMAISLAEMHWRAKIDAADVEFVLGAEAELFLVKLAVVEILPPRTDTASVKKRSVHLWLLDFNQCKRISMDEAGVNQASCRRILAKVTWSVVRI